MVRQVKRPDEAEADLENTDELPMLDIAAYEAKLLAGNASDELIPPESVAHGLGREPIKATCEATSGRHAARYRSVDRGASAARAHARPRSWRNSAQRTRAAQARADNLALELEVTQEALHTALCRANDGERLALDKQCCGRGRRGSRREVTDRARRDEKGAHNCRRARCRRHDRARSNTRVLRRESARTT